MIVQENESLHPAQEDKKKEKIQILTAALDLNPDQAKKVEKIFSETYSKVQPLIKQKLDLYRNAKDEISSLLNDQQRSKWEARNIKQKNIASGVSAQR